MPECEKELLDRAIDFIKPHNPVVWEEILVKVSDILRNLRWMRVGRQGPKDAVFARTRRLLMGRGLNASFSKV